MTIQIKALSQLTDTVKRGITSYYFQEDGLETHLINIGAIQNGEVIINSVEKVNVMQTDTLQKSKVEAGDVLIGIKGSFKAAVADEKINGFAISSNIIALKLNGLMMPEILAAYLNSPAGQKEIQSRAGGAIQKSLTLKSLLEVPIPIPSIPEQKAFARYLSLLQEYNTLILCEEHLREKINNTILEKYLEVRA